jgi:GT2 family glycosyltransferase
LSDELVIAARDRAREPELPAATVERALATPIRPRPAPYDVVILSDAEADPERDGRVAAEFARHEHRVFHLGDHDGAGRRPAPPTLYRLPWPEPRGDGAIVPALEALRRREGLEATVIFVPESCAADSARAIRERLGWRIVTSAGAPGALAAASDVRVAFDAAESDATRPEVVSLAAGLPWPGRWAMLDTAIRAAWPRASVIVLTRDNLAFNRMCLASVFENTEYPNLEVIVVDNGSTDGTVEELERLAALLPNLRLILNDGNAGFGPGNNQGFAAATGDVLLLLNNDTVVPRGWLTRLARHLEDPSVGLIGPATNRTCNEAQLDIPYQTYGEYTAVARSQGERFAGERYPIRLAMMFCTGLTRATFERIGPLDERYEVGLFEDEDYALRVKAAGLTVTWTPEVYVHHAYHATTGKLLPTGEYMRLVQQNQSRFEEKWGICWERHRPIPMPTPTA